jgi:hypothetical protein
MNQRAAPRPSILAGILRIARGRADGIACFGASPQAFLSSLAPLLAFPLAGALLTLSSDGPIVALTSLAVALCAVLMPAVLSFELARLWKRQNNWLRFATAFNWCEWILPVVAGVAMLPLSLAVAAGMDEATASLMLSGILAGYGLWLHWFLARNALGLSALRAVTLVILVNLATGVTLMGPHVVARLL